MSADPGGRAAGIQAAPEAAPVDRVAEESDPASNSAAVSSPTSARSFPS